MSERDAEGGIIVKAPATTNAGILGGVVEVGCVPPRSQLLLHSVCMSVTDIHREMKKITGFTK